MSTDRELSTAHDTSSQEVSLLDLLTAIEAGLEADEVAALAIERAEMVAQGALGIVEDLAMYLHAECAARGVDWDDLLAAATRRCLWPGPAN